MAAHHQLRARPAHTPGPTFLCYTPNGRKLITVGLNNAVRVFTTGSDAEPITIDDCSDSNTTVAATNDLFFVGSEDGMVSKYSLVTNTYEGVLVRSSLPIRDVTISPNRQWVAVASDELVVKVVSIEDMTKVVHLREQDRPAKHVTFDPSGELLTISCSDGQILVYSFSDEGAELITKIDGVVRSLETDSEASSRAIWHPDGRAFAAPTAVHDIQVISKNDWEMQRDFKGGHSKDITATAWSPNGALLATTGSGNNLLLWDTKTQKVVKSFDDLRATILAMAWHPTENIVSYTNNDGELFIHVDFVPSGLLPFLEKDLQPAPFIHDPLTEVSGNAQRLVNGNSHTNKESIPHRRRRGTPDSLDDILGDDGLSDDNEDNFVEDDDGGGYAEHEVNGYGKRTNGHLDIKHDYYGSKRAKGYGSNFSTSSSRPRIHPSFQPGSTPWRGNRRYLCLNLTGFVWTIDQDTHHTITVEFYDRELHRDFHFTDVFLYDKACLNEHGTLLSSPPPPASSTLPAADSRATVYYRPHETWTTRTDWRTQLPAGESVVAMALSDSYVVLSTSENYIRVFSLYGLPIRVYRQKSSPAVSCAAWRNYVMTVGNGPMMADGSTQLLYTLENVKRDETCQNEDVVALRPGTGLQSIGFSEEGDPYIYDTLGTLLTLTHWRTPSQAHWTPILDTRRLARRKDGKHDEERYWPVALTADRFHCIILKGRDTSPAFPRPLLSEFGLEVPLTSFLPAPSKHKSKNKNNNANDEDDYDDDNDNANNDNENESNEIQDLEQAYVLNSTLHTLLHDRIHKSGSVFQQQQQQQQQHEAETDKQQHHQKRTTPAQRTALTHSALTLDKTLLQLLAAECRAGEERGMKALEIVSLMRDRTGRMLEAAGKVAARFGRDGLGERIRGLAERRLVGLEVGSDEEMEVDGDGEEP